MKQRIILIILLLTSLASKAQERIYLSWFDVSNINKGYQVSATKIFKTFIIDNGKYDVVLPAMPDSNYKGETLLQAQENAKKQNAQFIVVGELNRIGSTVVVSVQMYKASDGISLWHGMLKAKTPDDLDAVLIRLAKNIGNKEMNKEGESIYDVSNYESNELKKIETNKFFGISIGGVGLIHPRVDMPAGLGLCFSYDVRNIILDAKIEAYFNNGAFYNLSIDGLYPLTEKNNSAFVGGGLGIGGMDFASYGNGGLMLFGNFGYIFNRRANTCLRLAAKPFVSTYKVDKSIAFGSIISLSLLFER